MSLIRYRYVKKPIFKVPIRYRYRYIDIGDISVRFLIYRPTSTTYSSMQNVDHEVYLYLYLCSVQCVYNTVTAKLLGVQLPDLVN